MTDGTGRTRIPVRVGVFQIVAELPGFTTVTRPGSPVAPGTDVGGRSADDRLDAAGNRHGHRRSAAPAGCDLEPRRQHRSKAGCGVARAGA